MIFSSNKKIIIIGATSGIGREMAKVFSSRGDMVGITGRRAELLEQVRSEFPSQIMTENFDVRSDQNILHLESLIAKLGGLDIIIYNSGYGDISKSLDWEVDRATFETNVKGFIEILNYAFNYFAHQGHGHIVATSSIASIRGNSWAPAYSASKAFQSNYMEGLHMKAKKMKLSIAITDIQPGFINTKIAKGNGQFWVAPVEKAVKQIIQGIDNKKWRVYVTRRWWIVAQLLKFMPGWMYHRIG